ncbi:MAG: 50S ribosomal protein L37e [Candidatus Woesearchaeota archaeon]
MGTGTSAFGRKSGKKTHIYCRRCGEHSYHKRKKVCSSCGFGRSAKLRSYNWQNS